MSRHYRTQGAPRAHEWEGERGVALPLKPPPSHLGVDPKATLDVLRRLHLDPALRARLATDDGPGIFTEVTGSRRET
ncbi:hypothetical protein [Janibacter limosus]|uniref:hypothetical protein n=1 Tax=Janibacter limosus TaxID=53458 RepID=UPI000AA75EC2|nr:hypothetical protein [Janibacter limosus]